jgi:hypothetical protein
MREKYVYELVVNGKVIRTVEDKFRTGIISAIIKDVPKIDRMTKEFIIRVKRTSSDEFLRKV